MTRVQISRHVAADPATVTMLLAEPPTELDHDRSVAVAMPRRAGIGFVAAVEVIDALGRVVPGDVTVVPATDDGCDVTLVVAAPDGSAARGVERSGAAFLGELSARAKARSRAA